MNRRPAQHIRDRARVHGRVRHRRRRRRARRAAGRRRQRAGRRQRRHALRPGCPTGRPADDAEDAELDEPVPNAERLVGAGGGARRRRPRAGARWSTGSGGSRPTRSWSATRREEMVEAARSHRELAEQRVPGELKLRITDPAPDQHAHGHRDRHRRHAVPGRLGDRAADRLPPRRPPAGAPAGRGAPRAAGQARRGRRRGRARRRDRRRHRRELDARSRSTRSATAAEPRAAARASCSGCSPTCARRSRTGRRCASGPSALADELAAARTSDTRPPVPEKDITDSVELLRWLAHDHFTFLGYREYRLVEHGDGRGGPPARPCSAPVWASCAQDQTDAARAVLDDARGAREGAGEAAADHHQGQLAGHRAPLGLPGLHRLQDLRRRRRRWSASGASSACSPAPPTAPACASCRWSAARSPRCSTAPACRPRSHSGKDLLQILETYPRDELFQIKTDDLYHAVDRRAADGRPPAAAAVPAPRRLRPVHLLPDLPAPRPVHHRRTGCACRRSCCAS